MVWESPPHILSKVFRKFYKSNNCNKAIDYTRHKYRYWVIFTILVFTPLATVEGIVPNYFEKHMQHMAALPNHSVTVQQLSKSDSHHPKRFLCFNESPLKMLKMRFNSFQKLISFSRHLNFCLDFSVIWEKWCEQKDNFKIYDAATWLTKNCNTHIA